MNLRSIFHFFIFSSVPSFSFSQPCQNQRYIQPLFEVEKNANVVFANVQALPPVYISEDVTVSQNLVMDIFMPAGDTLSLRPLAIFAFGGGFLIGGKDDEDAQAYCDSLARAGYVTASIQYRLGMNIASPPSAVRAIYRAAQDYSAAIRYLKEFAWQYRIDTNYIFSGGVSAGSFSAMNLAYMQEQNRPQETYAQSGFPPAPDLGCLHCSGNSYNHNTKVKALLNCWGAILDTTWIDINDDTPLISFHGTDDLIVPFGTGFPFTALFLMPEVYGSQPITQRASNIGLHNAFHPFIGQGHNTWGTVVNHSFVGGPTPYLDTIINETKDFFYPFLQPAPPVISGSHDVCAGDTQTYSVALNAGSHYCWEIEGGTIISQNQNIISVLWETAGNGWVKAREVNHLQALSNQTLYNISISECITSASVVADNSPFVIFPNPVSRGEKIRLNLPTSRRVEIMIMDVNGKNIFNQTFFENGFLNTSILTAGIYFVRLTDNENFCARIKLAVN